MIDQPVFCYPESGAPAEPEPPTASISRHLPQLKRFVQARAPKGMDPSDVTQDTLLLALRNIGSFRFEASIGTWLCKIALNVIRGRIRRPEWGRIQLQGPTTFEVVDSQLSPCAALERKEVLIRLYAAVARLPEPYRAVVELRDLGGLSTRETMQALSLSKAATKSRHYRARLMLTELVNDQARTVISTNNAIGVNR